ncbi:hypothetical protein GW17_00009393 [Ensete ventricosum]|nr:hypothetical protein GW17_00009393 [Ensete ventricosum]
MPRGQQNNQRTESEQQHGYLQKNRVAAEKLQLFHRLRVQRDHRVVIVDRLVHDQAIRRLLPLQNREFCEKLPRVEAKVCFSKARDTLVYLVLQKSPYGPLDDDVAIFGWATSRKRAIEDYHVILTELYVRSEPYPTATPLLSRRRPPGTHDCCIRVMLLLHSRRSPTDIYYMLRICRLFLLRDQNAASWVGTQVVLGTPVSVHATPVDASRGGRLINSPVASPPRV